MTFFPGSVAAMRLLSLVGGLSLAACSQQSSADVAARPAATLAAASAAPSSPRTAAVPASAPVVLDAEGIAFRIGSGKLERLAFGAPRAKVEALAARALGPAADRMKNDECGAGPMEFTVFTPLTLHFQDGALVGWSVERGTGVVTSDGIAPRAKFAALQRERSARLIDGSTLEGEFEYTAGDGKTIYGFVEGIGDKGEVASLYAGTSCLFR